MTASVLIVGAGPVGLTMATELARYGIPIRIVDKSPQRTDKSKALVIWSRTLELLDRGGSCAPFINAGFKVNGVNVVAGVGDRMGHIAMDSVDSPYPYALMLPQSDTERLLEERLLDLGVAVERNVEVTRLSEQAGHVEAVLRNLDGSEELLSVDWLLGCDGAHSIVRSSLDIDFAGETMLSDWMLADVHMGGYPYPDTDVSVYWHHDGVLVVFPISPGRYRVIANLPMTSGEHPPAPTLEQVQAIINHRGGPEMLVSEPIWLAGFRVNGRKVSDYRVKRMFLLGDAAHIHSPAGGQGMNTGMQDAFNLAWKLALVIRGSCDEQLLDSYSPERSQVGEEVLKSAGRLTTVGTLQNPVAQTIRNTVARFVLGVGSFQEKFANTMTEVSIGYPKSPLNGPAYLGAHCPAPGQRVVPVDGQLPVGSGDKPLFSLFAQSNESIDDLFQQFPELLDPELRPPLDADAIILVRPDGYVACSAKAATTVAEYLANLR